MVEWHIPFDHIVNHWTDEQLDLMVMKLLARKERESGPAPAPVQGHKVSPEILARNSRGMVKMVDHYGD